MRMLQVLFIQAATQFATLEHKPATEKHAVVYHSLSAFPVRLATFSTTLALLVLSPWGS
jgi:hypothetical protein